MFNNKGSFFLDLGSEGAQPAQVAVAAPKPAAKSASPAAIPASPVAPVVAEATTAAETGTTLTTVEAIAAELRAAQEAKPPASSVTFAPDCLNPANAVPSRRRRAGANLAGFKAMASGMFRN